MQLIETALLFTGVITLFARPSVQFLAVAKSLIKEYMDYKHWNTDANAPIYQERLGAETTRTTSFTSSHPSTSDNIILKKLSQEG